MGSLSSLCLVFLEQPREIDSGRFDDWRCNHFEVAEVAVSNNRGGKVPVGCVQGTSFHMAGNRKSSSFRLS